MDNKIRLLLHSCCGPCSTAVIERLLSEDEFDITVYYANSNITDKEEYELRKSEQIRFLQDYCAKNNIKIDFVEGEYNPRAYFEIVHGYEDAPEGGIRCNFCFSLRLDETAKYAKEHGFECFDTTLTVSPYKNYDVISEICKILSKRYGITYLDGNYKKKEGYKRSIELSKEYGLYRQHYCGCEFSKIAAEKAREEKAKKECCKEC